VGTKVEKFRDGKNVIVDIKNVRRKRIRLKMRGERKRRQKRRAGRKRRILRGRRERKPRE
jgi:hypothetical protein